MPARLRCSAGADDGGLCRRRRGLPAGGAGRRVRAIRWAGRSRCGSPSAGPSSCGGSCSPPRPGSRARRGLSEITITLARDRPAGADRRKPARRADRRLAPPAPARLRGVRGLEPGPADRAVGARAAARPDHAHRRARGRARARGRRSAPRPRPRPLPGARPLGRSRPPGAARGRLRVRPPPARARSA